MRTIVLVAACAVAGCATTTKFRETMDGWMHSPEERFIAAYGPPQNVYMVSAEEKVLTYVQSSHAVIPGTVYSTPVTTTTYGQVGMQNFNARSTTYVPQQGAPTVIDLSCTINVTVRNGELVNWSANGNHCVSR